MFCRRGESAYAAVFFPYRGKYISFDEEGTELPDLNAVRAEAIRTAGEMLRDAGLRSCTDDPRNSKPWRLWITDGPGGAGKTRLSIHVLVQDGPPEELQLQRPA